jgi:hypothetical protein
MLARSRWAHGPAMLLLSVQSTNLLHNTWAQTISESHTNNASNNLSTLFVFTGVWRRKDRRPSNRTRVYVEQKPQVPTTRECERQIARFLPFKQPWIETGQLHLFFIFLTKCTTLWGSLLNHWSVSHRSVWETYQWSARDSKWGGGGGYTAPTNITRAPHQLPSHSTPTNKLTCSSKENLDRSASRPPIRTSHMDSSVTNRHCTVGNDDDVILITNTADCHAPSKCVTTDVYLPSAQCYVRDTSRL